jgi:hypothetical protein
MGGSRRLAPAFHLGDWVSFRYGMEGMRAQVIEDRGRLGVNGRRIYRLRVDRDWGESVTFEMSEDNLEAATAPVP